MSGGNGDSFGSDGNTKGGFGAAAQGGFDAAGKGGFDAAAKGGFDPAGKDSFGVENKGGFEFDGGAKGAFDAGASAAAPDSFTETTTRSWFSRIGGALTGILVGLVLIPVACWLLFWNEGHAVAVARSLTEGAGSVVSTPAERVNPALEGKLIHLSGPLRVSATLTDGDTGVSVQGAVALRRRVEMYQWRESSSSSTSTNLGGGQTTQTTYSYTRTWSDTAIDSGRFRQPGGHANPAMPLTERSFVAPEAQLGAFRLGEPELRLLRATDALPLEGLPVRGPSGRRVQVAGNTIYVGNDPNNPALGDLRISYEVARPAAVSLVARQQGQGLAPFTASNGQTLHMVVAGLRPAAEMFQEAQRDNAILTWVLRAAGTVLMLVGFLLIFQPIRVLADVVPIFGSIVGFGTGLLAAILTLLLAPLVIAIAWLAYRPILAVVVLALGAGLAFGLGWLRRRRAPLPAAAARAG